MNAFKVATAYFFQLIYFSSNDQNYFELGG